MPFLFHVLAPCCAFYSRPNCNDVHQRPSISAAAADDDDDGGGSDDDDDDDDVS